MKCRAFRLGIALLLCAVLAFLIWAFFLRRPKTYAERYPNQIGVSKEVCEQLLSDYEDSFDTLVSSLTSHIAETELDYYHIRVDERGHIDMPKELRRDDELVTAIKTIHSDDLFRTNPLTIHAQRTKDGVLSLSIMLVCIEDDSRGSMVYWEDGIGTSEGKINDHWSWNVFLMI